MHMMLPRRARVKRRERKQAAHNVRQERRKVEGSARASRSRSRSGRTAAFAKRLAGAPRRSTTVTLAPRRASASSGSTGEPGTDHNNGGRGGRGRQGRRILGQHTSESSNMSELSCDARSINRKSAGGGRRKYINHYSSS